MIDFDEVPDVADPVDPKKRYMEDVELLKNTVKENIHAQENMDMGSLSVELAKGLVEDVKTNLVTVTHHIEQDLSVDQEIDQSDDSQGKMDMDSFEQRLHSMSEDGSKSQREQAKERATMIKNIIPVTVDLEQKLGMLPEGTFLDKDMDLLETKMDKIIGANSEKKPAAKAKASKKHSKK